MYDIVIQAGHEGGWRNRGRTGKTRTTGTLGVPGGPTERHLTPIVADHAAAALSAAGYNVKRVSALYPSKLKAKLSVSIHFDGSTTPCASGASIGYPSGKPAGSNQPAAGSWNALYAKVWPFKWMGDNFTRNLRGYYGFGWVSTLDAELVLELGELTCPEQQAWLVERVESGYLGQLIAHWASGRLGGTVVPMPDPPATGRSVPVGRLAGVLASAVAALDAAEIVVRRADRIAEYAEGVAGDLRAVVADLQGIVDDR